MVMIVAVIMPAVRSVHVVMIVMMVVVILSLYTHLTLPTNREV